MAVSFWCSILAFHSGVSFWRFIRCFIRRFIQALTKRVANRAITEPPKVLSLKVFDSANGNFLQSSR